MTPAWMNPKDASEYLGHVVSPLTLVRLARRKKIKCGRTAPKGTKGAEVCFKAEDLDAWLRVNAGWPVRGKEI